VVVAALTVETLTLAVRGVVRASTQTASVAVERLVKASKVATKPLVAIVRQAVAAVAAQERQDKTPSVRRNQVLAV
jgi:hypothetical protein